MKHQVRKVRNNFSYLRDGAKIYCPWNRDSLCSSWCPFFDLKEINSGWRLTLSCVPCAKLIALDEEAPIVES